MSTSTTPTPATMICMMVLLKVRPGKEEETRALLSATAASTRQEPGCLQYDLHVGLEDPKLVAIYERWRDQAAIDAHMKMPYVQSLFARIPELFSEPPTLNALRLHG